MSMCLYPLCLCLCLYAQKPGTWLSFHVHKKARKLAVIIFIFPQTLIADPALKESPTCAATAALLLGPRSGCLRTASATAEKKKVLSRHQPNSPRSTHLLSAVISLKKIMRFYFSTKSRNQLKKKGPKPPPAQQPTIHPSPVSCDFVEKR